MLRVVKSRPRSPRMQAQIMVTERAREKQRSRLTSAVPPSSKASVELWQERAQVGRLLEASRRSKSDGAPSTATVAVAEDTGEIDEAGICGCWSDDDDSWNDISEAWALCVWRVTTCQQTLSSSRPTALVQSTVVHGTFLRVAVIWVPRLCC